MGRTVSDWKDLQLLGRLGVILTVPAVLVAGPLVGALVGGAIDRRWHTAPWALAIGAAVGGAGSAVEVYRILRWIARVERN